MGAVVDPSFEHGADSSATQSTESATSASASALESPSDEPAATCGSLGAVTPSPAPLGEGSIHSVLSPAAPPPYDEPRGSLSVPLPPLQRTGHPVRDRLLARAQSIAEQSRTLDPMAELTPFTSLKDVETDLDEVAAPRRSLVGGPGALSPTTIMVTGTLVGAAAISLMFALLVQFAPRHGGTAPQPVESPPTAPTQASEIAAPAASPQAEPMRTRMEGPWRITRAGTGQQLIKGTIGRAAFLTAVQGAGLSKTHAYQAFNALKGVANLDRCRPSNEFLALVNRQTSELEAFEYIAGKEEIYQARRENGALVGKALDLKVERKRVEGAFVISGESFAPSLANTTLDPSIGRSINKALDGHTSVEQFRLGDRVRVIAQEVTVLGEFARYSGIEALEYLPAHGAALRVYYHSAKRRYYDAKGRAPGEGGWRKPIKGAPVTSKFNPNRMHPILKKRMPHNGTDFGVPTGTPIHASSFGVINKLGPFGPNGNFIGITHAKNYETGYSHLSRFEPGLKVGDKVESLQVIGYVGSTGRSTGPHLHFSAKKNGAFIDPESLNLDALIVLPPSERGVFEELRRSYDQQLDSIALPPPLETAPVPSVAPETGDMDGEAGLAAEPALNGDSVPALAPVPAPLSAPRAAPALVKPSTLSPRLPGASIYLTDRELMETQAATDDGEVDE
jgi:murein DD-endopeptidase MepM/ murein hydrolase activator NlpD